MADWEDAGHAQQGDLSNDRAGQKEHNAYVDAARTHGASSPQAREALQAALSAGWTFSGLGPDGGAKRGGGRRSGIDRRGPGVDETGG